MKPPKSVTGEPHPTAVGLSLLFAVPDHPWVDNANGAVCEVRRQVLGKQLTKQIDNHRKRVLGILPLPSNRGEPKTSEAMGREWTVTDFGGFMRAPAIPAPAHPEADDQSFRIHINHYQKESCLRRFSKRWTWISFKKISLYLIATTKSSRRTPRPPSLQARQSRPGPPPCQTR